MTIQTNLKAKPSMIKAYFFVLSFFIVGLCMAQKPTIYVLATGGTIAGTGTSQTTSAYKAGEVSVEQLLNAVPSLADIASIRSEQVVNIGSQDMNIEVWLKLAARINELAKDPGINGFVITHGTDTQEETAYFLNLVAKTDKPIVMVGSMRPSTALGADGPRNLFNAVACATSPQSRGRGVMVVMNDVILGADDLEKTHTLSVQTFQNPNYGPLGIMYNKQPFYSRNTLKKHTSESEFDVTGLKTLPRVEIVMGYAGAGKLFVDAATHAGVQGLVYAGVGNGNMAAEVVSALAAAVKNGVAVVRSSRLPAGPTSQWDEVDDDANGFAASWFLTPQKARILLMLALTKTKNYKEIQRIFTEY